MSGRILTLMIAAGLLVAGPVCSAAGETETVCLQCHAGQPGELGAPVKVWQGSVHQRNGVSCHDCHGGDPADFANAMSPERGFIGAPDYAAVPEFCGRCHVGVLSDYQQSAHGLKVNEGGAQCVTCHGNHAVQEASLDLINDQDCARCHDYARAAEIRAALVETDARLTVADRELEHLRLLGVDTEELKGRLFDLRNRFHRVFHSVEVEKVRAETGGVQTGLAKIDEAVAGYGERFAQRRIWGGAVVVLLMLLGIVLLQIRHTYAEEERHD